MTKPVVLTIGNFDGVHLGHRKLIGSAHEYAKKLQGETVVMTFSPHPTQVLAPHRPYQRLSQPSQQKTWMKEAGADRVEVQNFDEAFASLSPEDFFNKIVLQQFRAQALFDDAVQRVEHG